MKILLLGLNGAFGQIVLDELLKSIQEVTALVRNAAAIQAKHPGFSVMQGTPTDAVDLDEALVGHDAVLSERCP